MSLKEPEGSGLDMGVDPRKVLLLDCDPVLLLPVCDLLERSLLMDDLVWVLDLEALEAERIDVVFVVSVVFEDWLTDTKLLFVPFGEVVVILTSVEP